VRRAQLGKGDPDKVYLLRAFGREGHEIGTSPIRPSPKVLTRLMGMSDPTELLGMRRRRRLSGLDAAGWRARMTQIYDLSDPANPVKIRDFGLVGQQPGATGAVPVAIHGLISSGPRGNRVYLAFG